MTRRRAEELVAKSNGNICLRYYRSTDGRIVTADNPLKLHQLTRRASRLAAGAFTIALSMSSLVGAQATPKSKTETSAQDKSKDPLKISDNSKATKIYGEIKDPNGAVIAGATVHLNRTGDISELETTSSDTGEFVFENPAAGTYNITVIAQGFKRTVVKDVEVQSGVDVPVTVNLQVSEGSESFTAGGAFVAMPSDLLVLAALEDDLEGLKVLIDVGLDVNKVDEITHTTALYHAVENNNIEMAKLLIALGAEPNPSVSTDVDKDGKPIIGTPALTGIGAKTTIEMVELIVNAGGQINLKDQWRRTPLMAAALHEDTAVLNKLIELGANVNDVDSEGDTALSVAVQTGRVDVARLLIAAGAKVNHQNNEGVTALMSINGESKLEMVKLLLDSKADLKPRDKSGNTALLSNSNDDTEILEALIKAGAKIDDADDDGTTSLMYAASCKNLENVKALIEAKAEINRRDKDGKTALQQAIENNKDNSNLEVIKLLKQNGAVQ